MTPVPVALIRVGHVLTELAGMPAESVHCVVTSPPYWGLRDYGIDPQVWPDGWVGSLGAEPTPELYVAHMVAVFREVRRVLRADGTAWVNLGDSYANDGKWGGSSGGKHVAALHGNTGVGRGKRDTGLKPKDLVGIPWRVAFALQADGWYLRSDIIWHKPNPMPESIRDRPTKAHEYVFLLTRSPRYFYDAEAIKEECESGPSDVRKMVESLPATSEDDGTAPLLRNARSVWTVATQPYSGAHFATFPEELARRCIAAGTSTRGCCPECGAPWRRVVEREYAPTDRKPPPNKGRLNQFGERASGMTACGFIPNREYTDHARGWSPTCAHALDPIPCTVLDPFGGAGTTGLVAQGLGRSWVLIEIKPEYAEMSRARIHGEAPLFNTKGEGQRYE